MTRDEYLAYLRSPWWTARKAAIIRFRGPYCERCRSDKRLELHHRTYERLGHEKPEDLELLCDICHQREHGNKPSIRPWDPQPIGGTVAGFLHDLTASYTQPR